jgi:hypothetical protein
MSRLVSRKNPNAKSGIKREIKIQDNKLVTLQGDTQEREISMMRIVGCTAHSVRAKQDDMNARIQSESPPTKLGVMV